LLSPSSPGRPEDRRGGFLVPGADLTQRLGSSHGVIESVFAMVALLWTIIEWPV
jgi:hypothetical protein